jgi:hypothetical protein
MYSVRLPIRPALALPCLPAALAAHPRPHFEEGRPPTGVRGKLSRSAAAPVVATSLPPRRSRKICWLEFFGCRPVSRQWLDLHSKCLVFVLIELLRGNERFDDGNRSTQKRVRRLPLCASGLRRHRQDWCRARTCHLNVRRTKRARQKCPIRKRQSKRSPLRSKMGFRQNSTTGHPWRMTRRRLKQPRPSRIPRHRRAGLAGEVSKCCRPVSRMGGLGQAGHGAPRRLWCRLSPGADMPPHWLWAATGQRTKSLRDSGVHGLAAEH